MALDHFLVFGFPTPLPPGVRGPVNVWAVDASGNVQTGYAGTVTFTSTDPLANLPAPYTFVGGDAGKHLFYVTFGTVGPQTLTVTDLSAAKSGDMVVTIVPAPQGWGFDPYGTSPYGSGEAGVGVHIVSALALSTNQVQVTLNIQPLSQIGSTPGDALNPNTWTIQRLDTNSYLNPVDVQPVTTTEYLITTLQPFAPASVQHTISSTTLLDQSGNLIVPPRSANFAGLLGFDVSTNDRIAAAQKIASRDLANPPFSKENVIGGTLIITGQGDYDSVTGVELLRKLIMRRLTTPTGGFFHLPSYGIGLQPKALLKSTDLAKLKASIEAQVKREPEVQDASATLLLDQNSILTVQLAVMTKPDGQQVVFTLKSPTSGAGA